MGATVTTSYLTSRVSELAMNSSTIGKSTTLQKVLLQDAWVFFFFFSSRRRHTRYWRDWSSDVCSSDLDRSLRWPWHIRPGPKRRSYGKDGEVQKPAGHGRASNPGLAGSDATNAV